MRHTILTLARFTLLEAHRARLWAPALAVLALASGAAWLLGELAITETRAIQAALAGSLLRIAAVFLLATFIAAAQSRETADKVTEMLLALPAPRAAYYLGKLLGFVGLACLLALFFGAAALALSDTPAALAWTASLAFELSIVAAATLFFASAFTSVPAALAAVAGFYVLARAMAAFRLISAGALLDDGSAAREAVRIALDLIAFALPRLDLYTQSAWLAVKPPDFGPLLSVGWQALVYVGLLAAAGLIDLYRRNF